MKKIVLLLAFALGLALTGKSQVTFDPNTDHSISLTDAAAMTKAFRTAHPTYNIGAAFGKTALLSVLNQTGCVGIRYYYASDANGLITLVGVGVTANNADMTYGVIIERAICCAYHNCFPCLSALTQ